MSTADPCCRRPGVSTHHLRGARFLGVQGDDPLHLAELCVPVADVAGRRQLRSASRGLLNFPRYNMPNYGRRAFCFAGPHVWNSLPEHIRQSTPIAVFKRSLKTFLVFLLQQIVPSALETIIFYCLWAI